MDWNWQKLSWPSFRHDPERLAAFESRFLEGRGRFVGGVQHLDPSERTQLTVELLTTEAVETSKIAGETLAPESVRPSIRRSFGLTADGSSDPAESGIAEMMVDLYGSAHAPLTEEALFSWSGMIHKGADELHEGGGYRSSSEAVQIVSGPARNRRIDFEAPPAADVPGEMDEFIRWFNRTAEDGPDHLPLLTRAGIAHLYFECIQPFENGNGRIGRAIAEKALTRGAGDRVMVGLSGPMLRKKNEYYRLLAASNRRLEITDWLVWFAEIALEAQASTMDGISFAIEKKHLLDRLRDRMNERQEKALLAMLDEGPEGFPDGLSAGDYLRITGTSPATATRDLVDLVEKGALRKEGDRKWARYHLVRGRASGVRRPKPDVA
ncbi:MAG: Fic family protein [Rhodothermales bacterium]